MSEYTAESLHKLQQVELEILKVIDDFCRANEITYFLDGGSCLGAVRHGGFIPWDDDIDIGMMRSDYERFVTLFSENPPDGYSIHTHLNTENYPYLFAKVYREGTKFLAQESIDAGLDSCIYLDIFLYDAVRSDLSEKEVGRIIKRAFLWQRVMYLYYTPNPAVQPTESFRSLKKLACKAAHRLVRAAFSPEGITERYERNVRSLATPGEAGEVDQICCIHDFGCLRYRDVYPPSDLMFEGRPFPCPCNADAYLTLLYGDYLRLPPEDKRKTHSPQVLDFGEL